MSLIALYVYSPTTFESDSPIESEADVAAGTSTKPARATGTVTLAPGIYRVRSGATLRAVPSADSNPPPSHEVVTLGDTKTNWPDPSARAMNQFGKTANDIKQFLASQGGITKLVGKDEVDDDQR